MGAERSNRILKVFIGILAICLVGLGIYTVQFHNETQSNLNILEREKAQLETELHDLKMKYENAIENNRGLEEELTKAKSRIENLMASIENTKINYARLQQYRNQIAALKQENKELFAVVDSLKTQNKSLQQEINNTKTELSKTEQFSDSLMLKNKKLAEKVFKASQLQITSANSTGAILRGGKTVPTDNPVRAEKIQVCFTLGKNELALPGKKEFYVQIINPQDAVLGEREVVKFGEAVLYYSKIVSVNYKNQEIETCTLVDALKQNLLPGRYIVNVFSGPELLSSQIFTMGQ
jgi:predicted nuclease with TOPRIM domain